MPGKEKKTQSKPITAFLNLEGGKDVSNTTLRLGQLGPLQEQCVDSSITVSAIRQIIVQKVGKIEMEVKQFKNEICKAFDSLECKVDSRLAEILQKIQVLEVTQKELTADNCN